MRLKFRAWTGNEMRYDIVGFDWDESFGVHNAWLGNNIEYNADNFLMNVLLLQYTGLKDKNGVEIYEGDIVKRTHLFNGGLGETHTGEVFYDKDYARYVISRPQKYIEPKTEDLRNTLSDRSTYEVIGNIYENKELLKEETKWK